jgi:eukaryotic-like serine/threonine-protein kinase
MNGQDGFLLRSADVEQHRDGDTIASDAPPGQGAATGPGARDQPAGLPGPGDRIGQYELIRELGRGGMGAVFLARDTKLGRRVAIKFLHGHNPELTARFILEARATARCHHENIIVIHDVAEHHGNPYMVLEYLEGSPLSKLLGKDHGLPPGRAVELMVPVVRALVRAHAHNIVHRDLKPDNIFVTDSGTVKVLDFGIAKLVQGNADDSMPGLVTELAEMFQDGGNAALAAELTRRGSLVGTIPYMSPEQWGAGAVDHRTDIWAVGILLFRMLAGRHPLWPAAGRELMITGLIDEPMPRLRSKCPSVPDELAAIVDHCLIKRKEQRIGAARELLDALEPLLPGRAAQSVRIDECPYAGLSAFQESDAGRFFGRAREITAAVTRLREQPLMAVVGPSGVGKSSFVRAGVVPALKQSGETWSSLVIRPGRQPMDALVHLIAPMMGEQTMTVAEDVAVHQALLDRLHREPGYLGAVLRHRARSARQNILLFVDQFEELYTLVDDARERQAYAACLASVADDAAAPLRLILSIRSDFLDRAAEDERFMAELGRGLFFLVPPGRQGMREALVQPAEMAGYRFEAADMVEHMLDHLEHTPGALPLLQFAATRLWDTRDPARRTLTRQSYDAIGGIAGALASHADAVVAELAPQSQALARAVLLRLVTPERTRAIVSMDELGELSQRPDEIMRLVEHLVHARLLVVQSGMADAETANTVEIVHESLIHGWPLLRRWLDENQDDAAYLEQLRSAARQWDRRGRPAGLLWRGEAVVEAERWHRRYRGELSPVQRDYLHAVFAQGARAARARRIVIGSVIALLSVMVAAAAVALVLIRDAQTEAQAQADRAEAQAHRAEAQLERALTAEAQATAERERAVAAGAEVARANEALEQKNAALMAAVEAAETARSDAEAARERAETAKKRARRSRKRAEEQEHEARLAESRARDASTRLQTVLEAERQRIKQLEAQAANTAVIEDIPGSAR